MANIRKGERRAKGGSLLTSGLCRAVSYIRETNIAKGESNAMGGGLFTPGLCRAASYIRETNIVLFAKHRCHELPNLFAGSGRADVWIQ